VPAVHDLALLAPASHWHVNSVFAGEDRIQQRSGAPEVVVHADDAAALGLEDGAKVDVGNRRGSFRAVLRVGDAARPGVAVTTKGRWAKLSPGGTTVNATVEERDSDMGGGAVYHDNRVRITPAAD
jgi:anaerobic selenocysteine-containing dehydrogenase